MITKYGLPNIINEEIQLSRIQWKNIVRNKVKKYSEDRLTSQFSEYSKLRGGPLVGGGLEVKQYIKELKMHEARTMFLIRTQMMPVKLNMKNNPRFDAEKWKCDVCKMLDSQSHILWCQFFAPLIEGKDVANDRDLVEYFQKLRSAPHRH